MVCEVSVLLSALRLALSLVDSGDMSSNILTLECTTCKCPSSYAVALQCKADAQKQHEKDYAEAREVLRLCDVDVHGLLIPGGPTEWDFEISVPYLGDGYITDGTEVWSTEPISTQ